MKNKIFKWNSLSFLSSSLLSWIVPLGQSAQLIARGIILDWLLIIIVHYAALFGFSKLFNSEKFLEEN
tara:strand:- start:1053 stop:1256 length:204 start_codon:yes stop_codon:yes gene_type:complete